MTERVSAVVPSYCRAESLSVCLGALKRQDRPVDELIVVQRDGDERTGEIARSAGAAVVRVAVPGVLAAMAAGARSATGSHVAFLDDDVEPGPDWVRRCLAHLAEPTVGAVSGRDIVEGDEHHPSEPDPGRLTAWGKMRGDHHLGAGSPRDVDVLKACNIMFVRGALVLPVGLRGAGAQPHFEVAACLAAQRDGWLIRYDPSIQVAHRPARRWDDDQRGAPNDRAVQDASYNLVRSICAYRPDLFWRRAAYGLMVGDRAVPGVGRAVVATLRGDRETARKLRPSLRGQLEALRAARAPVALAVERFTSGRTSERGSHAAS